MAKSSIVSGFGFASSVAASSGAKFSRGPSLQDYVETGKGEDEAALLVLAKQFGLDATDERFPTQLRNALQWYASTQTKDVESKRTGLTVNVVRWSAFRIPTYALSAARAGSLTGELTVGTLATLARIYWNDAPARTAVRENRATWDVPAFVPIATVRRAPGAFGSPADRPALAQGPGAETR